MGVHREGMAVDGGGPARWGRDREGQWRSLGAHTCSQLACKWYHARSQSCLSPAVSLVFRMMATAKSCCKWNGGNGE
jgi:hypothetical protein